MSQSQDYHIEFLEMISFISLIRSIDIQDNNPVILTDKSLNNKQLDYFCKINMEI